MPWIRDYYLKKLKEGEPNIENCPKEWAGFMAAVCRVAVFERLLEIAVSLRRSGKEVTFIESHAAIQVYSGVYRCTAVLFSQKSVEIAKREYDYPATVFDVEDWSRKVAEAVLDDLGD